MYLFKMETSSILLYKPRRFATTAALKTPKKTKLFLVINQIQISDSSKLLV
jgi:hypothetical protein